MEAEFWRPVVGYEGAYEVSDFGRVRSLPGGQRHAKVLAPSPAGRGYLTVCLCAGGIVHRRYIHHLVAESFVGSRPEGMDVCHDNGDLLDNRATNLRYDTGSANNRDTVRHGRHQEVNRTFCSHGHPLTAENVRIDSNGIAADGRPKSRRRCRTCLAEKSKRDYRIWRERHTNAA